MSIKINTSAILYSDLIDIRAVSRVQGRHRQSLCSGRHPGTVEQDSRTACNANAMLPSSHPCSNMYRTDWLPMPSLQKMEKLLLVLYTSAAYPAGNGNHFWCLRHRRDARECTARPRLTRSLYKPVSLSATNLSLFITIYFGPDTMARRTRSNTSFFFLVFFLSIEQGPSP
jgi:hypothetical protein